MKNKTNSLTNYFQNIETTQEHDGYFLSVPQALAIVILGSLCGLKNLSQIHTWAVNETVTQFLKENVGIKKIPSYYWLTQLIAMIKPDSLNECFTAWVQALIAGHDPDLTVSFDGKTVRSMNKMEGKKPLHIISAHIGNLKLTLAQQAVEDKSNEIPAVQELIRTLNLEGCMVVADALNCQKETAQAIRESGADYLLNAKGNQKDLMEALETYVGDPFLKNKMETATTLEKNRGRIEERTAYVTQDISWLESQEIKGWRDLSSIGAIYRRTVEKGETREEWHYFISSRVLDAEDLLKHARLEWSVEAMHWLLDVHFEEDYCRLMDRNSQKTMNAIRKIALNTINLYKKENNSKKAVSKIMLNCLIDSKNLLELIPFME